jgi:hypothetical protein
LAFSAFGFSSLALASVLALSSLASVLASALAFLGSAFFFGSAFFLAFVAVPSSSFMASLTAAWKTAFLSGLASATFSVPSAPGSPLNFCQSPVILRMLSTGSVGCAPTPSQYWARSELTSMNEGFSLG